MIQAPPVRVVNLDKLSANFAEISWDQVGANFRYEVALRSGGAADQLGAWRRIDYTADTSFFFSDNEIQPNSYYQFRVRTVFQGFRPANWTESETVLSFATNSYSYENQEEFTLSQPFTRNFFELNDKSYLDVERDQLQATLVRPGFAFDESMEFFTEASNSFVRNNGFQVVYGEVPEVCRSRDRVIPTIIDDVIYAFERFQGTTRVSNDGGQTWFNYNALVGRAGNPIEDCICQQNRTHSYVLGYDRMYQGIRSTDLTFDNDVERWSTIDFTFERLDVENPFGFDTERFTPLAMLPTSVRRIAESFSVDNYQVVVAAEDKLYEYNIRHPLIDADSSSPTFGQRIFETTEYRITGTTDAVIKKAEFYTNPDIGVDVGTFYFLVTGVWERNTDTSSPDFGDKTGVDDTSAIRGVYRMNRTPVMIANPNYDPNQPTSPTNQPQIIDEFRITGFTRVFGNTEAERARITENSTLSRDEKNLLIGVELTQWNNVVDPDLPSPYTGVKYYKQQLYTTSKKIRLEALGTNAVYNAASVTFAPVAQDYYGSAQFNWMQRGQTRDFKDWQNRIIYIRPDTTFTVDFDTFSRNRWTYTFNRGTHTFDVPDLTIRNFDGYTDGALIHTKRGRMLGYYKFTYRINNEAEIRWIPDRRMLRAILSDYTPRVVPATTPTPTTKVDPTIAPLVDKMAPATYLSDDSMYRDFAQHYLRFISEGNSTPYNRLLNLLNSQYARDTHYTEYIYKEIYARNRILNAETREAVTRFFLSRENDFTSTKGILNSYKFLFKLLYNDSIDIEVESLNRFEYFITVSSNDVNDDIVGRRIYTPTASADVTYYDRMYINGVLHWRLTLNNLIGEFMRGQQLQSASNPSFTGSITEGVQGDTTNYNSEDFKNRSNAFYVMKIRSTLQINQYKDDVIRFIHPIGFNFLGITLLTVLINQGLSIEHIETIVNVFKNVRFDSGGGLAYPQTYPRMDRSQPNPSLEYDSNGNLIEVAHPHAGEDPLGFPNPINKTGSATESQYNTFWGNTMLYNQTPYQRRAAETPTFDSSWVRWVDFINQASRRLKDNIGNPYDPAVPTQVKVGQDGTSVSS